MNFSRPMTLTHGDLVRVLRAVEFEGQKLDEPDYRIDPLYADAPMYDRDETCLAVFLPNADQVRQEFFLRAYQLLGERTATRLSSKSRRHGAGLDMILYFPGVRLED